MALPKEEWLHLAQQQCVGQSNRYHHKRERRPNLIVHNDPDRYRAYCMLCKQGGVVMKEHVRITAEKPPEASHSLTMPTDMVRLLDAPEAVQAGVVGLLAAKGMDLVYLPDLHFSKSRLRLLMQTPQGWLGRDTSGASPQKWLTYNGQGELHNVLQPPASIAVVVEDPFSYYKVRWAVSHMPSIKVFSSLGTKPSDALMLELMKFNRVVFFYDGDKAGQDGAEKARLRCRGFGLESEARCAPLGKDPKDMSIDELRFWLIPSKE